MSSSDEKAYRMQEAIKLVERLLPLKKWNFKESARFFYNVQPIVIYDSERCSIRVMYSATSRYTENMMVVHYGRLEVPDNASILLSQAQDKDYHLLWHSVYYALDFLDGISPQEAKAAKAPRFVREFEQSDVAKNIKYEPEKTLIMHATIWETYGQQLFDIFDTRNQDLWEQYSAFVREFWKTLPQP
jgi:hypothetical protein